MPQSRKQVVAVTLKEASVMFCYFCDQSKYKTKWDFIGSPVYEVIMMHTNAEVVERYEVIIWIRTEGLIVNCASG